MNVLVTGGAGQLAAALRATAPADLEVVLVPRDECEVTSAASVAACLHRHRPDVVVNAAAYTRVDAAEADAEQARAVNEVGAANVARAVRDLGARLVHVSTDFVFDGSVGRPWRPDDRTNPLGVYGATKAAGERAVQEALGGRAIVLRTAWLYSRDFPSFLATMLRLLQERGEVRVVDDQVGTPTSSRSLARAIWRIVARPGLAGTFHWTDAGVASWYDFADAIAAEGVRVGLLQGTPVVHAIGTADYPTRARRPSYSVLDKRSTIAALGLAPRHWRRELTAELERTG